MEILITNNYLASDFTITKGLLDRNNLRLINIKSGNKLIFRNRFGFLGLVKDKFDIIECNFDNTESDGKR